MRNSTKQCVDDQTPWMNDGMTKWTGKKWGQNVISSWCRWCRWISMTKLTRFNDLCKVDFRLLLDRLTDRLPIVFITFTATCCHVRFLFFIFFLHYPIIIDITERSMAVAVFDRNVRIDQIRLISAYNYSPTRYKYI